MFQNYVLGLIFDTSAQQVLLIRKLRPRWQAGKLNGVGGKVESGESARQALVREVREETSLETAPDAWRYFGVLEGSDFRVYCFETRLSDLSAAVALTDEQLEVHPVDFGLIASQGQGNLAALVLHALDADRPFVRMAYRESAENEAEALSAEVTLSA